MVTRTTSIKSAKVLSDNAIPEIFLIAATLPLKALGKTDVMVSECAVFWCIVCAEGTNQAGVANLTGGSQKTVSKIISNLGEVGSGLGWVEQRVDPDDRRSRRLYLTKKGHRIKTNMVQQLAKRRNELIAREGGVLD